MFSRIVSIPFVLLALTALYLAWEVDQKYALYLIPAALGLSLIHIFSPQIDWWWYKRRTPELAPPLRQLIEKGCKFYQQLQADEKSHFRQRVFLFSISFEYMPQGRETMPEDLKAMIAASAATLTFYKKDFLLRKFENIILYPYPFPTPQYQEKFHASEIYEEDGVIMFAAEQLARGFMQSDQYYNIALHEFAKVYQYQYPKEPWPDITDEHWDALAQISGFSREAITKWINLDDIEPFPVSVSHFFVFPEKFKEVLPEIFETYTAIFTKPE